MQSILHIMLFVSTLAVLPYEFMHCRQQEVKNQSYLLQDRKLGTYHFICDPEQHYKKSYKYVDSIIMIDQNYDIYIKAKIYDLDQYGWFRIYGKPGRPHSRGTQRRYYGEWTTQFFHANLLPKIKSQYPNIEIISSQKAWKKLKKRDKKRH